jgi:predicted outer membrane repeat protein
VLVPDRAAVRFVAAIALLCLSPCARADVFEVGSGPACTHASLQAAINAAAVTTAVDVIKVTRSISYTGLALTLGDQSLYLRGGWPGCGDAAHDGVHTVLNGNNSAPVLTISGGGSVSIEGFDFTNGNSAADTGGGGGIRIVQNANGRVELADVQLHNNNAAFGGGLLIYSEALTPEGGPQLVLGNDVRVRFNHARRDGGALYCRGARVSGIALGLEFALNDAAGNGGAIHAERCSVVLASPGGPFAALFAGNVAGGIGGAMALFNSSALVYGVAADAPLRFSGNSADYGGAIGVIDQSTFTGYETRFDGNRAYDTGGAIYQFNGVSLATNRVLLRRRRGDGPGVNCSAPECGSLSGNQARDADGSERTGALVRAIAQSGNTATETVLAGQEVFENRGISLFRGNETLPQQGRVRLVLENSLLHHNRIDSGDLIHGAAGTDVEVISSTMADNLGSGYVFGLPHNTQFRNTVRVRNSLIAEIPAVRFSSLTPDDIDVAYLRIHNDDGLFGRATVYEGPAGFVSPALYDYRLGPESAARDIAPAQYGSESAELDLLGTSRAIDLGPIVNGAGPQDLGAIEATVALPVAMFSDSFE